jgi:hypothetical protein
MHTSQANLPKIHSDRFPVLRLCQVIRPVPRLCVVIRNKYWVLRGRVVSSPPNPQAGGPPTVVCPRLLIQYIRSYPPYLETVSSIRNPRTRHAVVTGSLVTIIKLHYCGGSLDRVSVTGRAMAQAVSCRPPTAECRVRARFSPCEICGGQSGSGTSFCPSYSVFPCQCHCTVVLLHTRVSSGEWTICPLLAAVQRYSLIPSKIYKIHNPWRWCCLV